MASIAALSAIACPLALAQYDSNEFFETLVETSVEGLGALEITSVSKSEEQLRTAAAAVAVVSNEDIKRAGAKSIPEALRHVPGIYVGQRNSNSWAVSSRGFTSVNSEKLLVLSDTRSLYTPLVSGVSWDVQNYLFEDIDRIEVIRGPGAALWGSNAVNGVINITTKDSRDTQGSYLEAGGGNEDRANAGARYGGKIGEDLYYRVYGIYFDRDSTANDTPVTSDDWRMGQLGFRSDWHAGRADTVTFQGDLYEGDVGRLSPSVNIIGRPGPEGDLEASVRGGNILGRWQHAIGEESNLQLRAYYDRTHRNDPSFDDELNTGDLDFQHTFPLPLRQQITWGANYRYTANFNDGKAVFQLDPESSHDNLYSAFAQDQISILDTLRLTIGTKLEHNDFSGFEAQPSARAAWQASASHTVWAAFSRAARVPTRLERDVSIDVADPASDPLPRLIGSKGYESEELNAYELGHRWQPLDNLSLDLAAFYNDYEDLNSLEVGAPFADESGKTIIPVINTNLSQGRSHGVEALLSYSPLPYWRLSGSFSYIDLEIEPRGMDVNNGRLREGSTPYRQFGLRSFLDLPAGLQLDMLFRDVGRIRSLQEDATATGIDRYAELDIRLGWKMNENVEFSVIGQNLLDEAHLEFGEPAARGEIERSVYGQVVLRY